MFHQLANHLQSKHRLPFEIYEGIISKLSLFYTFDTLGLKDLNQLVRIGKMKTFCIHKDGLTGDIIGYEITKDGTCRYFQKSLHENNWLLCDPVIFECLLLCYKDKLVRHINNCTFKFAGYNRLDL